MHLFTPRLAAFLSKLNPCNKSRQRRNDEYFAMRRHETISPTLCEKLRAFIKSEYKWILGILLTITGMYIAYLKL